MVTPVILFLMIQYVPLFTTGFIPLVGPGGMFVSFILNLYHIIGVLIVVVPSQPGSINSRGRSISAPCSMP